MANVTRANLVVQIDYQDADNPDALPDDPRRLHDIRELLEHAVQHLVREGLLSGHTSLEIDAWNMSVQFPVASK